MGCLPVATAMDRTKTGKFFFSRIQSKVNSKRPISGMRRGFFSAWFFLLRNPRHTLHPGHHLGYLFSLALTRGILYTFQPRPSPSGATDKKRRTACFQAWLKLLTRFSGPLVFPTQFGDCFPGIPLPRPFSPVDGTLELLQLQIPSPLYIFRQAQPNTPHICSSTDIADYAIDASNGAISRLGILRLR